MNQLGRRFLYLIAGVAPACLGTAFAFALGPFVVAAVLGTIGLAAAALMRFPLSRQSYGRVALLLACGIALAVPLGAMLLYGLQADGINLVGWPAFSLAVWVFVGPVACAVHTLWAGGRAPNRSFKPNPPWYAIGPEDSALSSTSDTAHRGSA